MTLTLAPALLVLEDGSFWPGLGFGAAGDATGEAVFNTSLTGYQEILTDPSYHRQIVTMTAPHIGNYGVTPEDDESDRVWASGLVTRSISPVVSNWRARQSLPEFLDQQGVVAMTDVDTRALVSHIRRNGAMRAALSTSDPDSERLLSLARGSPDMNGLDLAIEVTTPVPYQWTDGQQWWKPEGVPEQSTIRYHVVAYDFGIKRNILRLLASRGCRVTVVPAGTSAADVLALHPDGIFLSNGPGDPAAATYAIHAVRQLLGIRPIFGICLGHQILALALGATTYKLKFGHRGANHPVQLTEQRSVQISSHNHGFAVDATTLPTGTYVSHVDLNDQCCEGIVAPSARAFSVQYHPESSPGPHDSDQLFDRFVEMMSVSRGAVAHA